MFFEECPLRSHLGTTGVESPPPGSQEHKCSIERSNEPQEHVNEIDPNGVLHTLNRRASTVVVANGFGIFMDVQLAKGAKDGRP